MFSLRNASTKYGAAVNVGAVHPVKRDGRAKTLPGLKNHQKKVTFSISIPSSNESKVKVQSE